VSIRVHWWFVYNNDRQFLARMTRPAGRGRDLSVIPDENPGLILVRHRLQGPFDVLKDLNPEFLKFLVHGNIEAVLDPIERSGNLFEFGVVLGKLST